MEEVINMIPLNTTFNASTKAYTANFTKVEYLLE